MNRRSSINVVNSEETKNRNTFIFLKTKKNLCVVNRQLTTYQQFMCHTRKNNFSTPCKIRFVFSNNNKMGN